MQQYLLISVETSNLSEIIKIAGLNSFHFGSVFLKLNRQFK